MILYAADSNASEYLKFTANVGPLVNLNAFGFNFTTFGPRLINSGTIKPPLDKEEFLRHMSGKVFYVSQQQYVNNIDKQTVWFKFV